MPSNMLTELKIDNFKSLKDTTISFSKNTFLIGLNGSGKTSILQAIDFLSVIASGKIEEWLKKREWDKRDLTFYGNTRSLIDIEVVFTVGEESYFWKIAFNKQQLRCTEETIYKKYGKGTNVASNDSEILGVSGGKYRLSTNTAPKKEKINFKYTGSILSGLKPELLGNELNNIRNFFKDIRSAELLTPLSMKKRAKESKDGIGLGGEKLSAFINGLEDENKEKLLHKLQNFFPKLQSIKTRSLQAGWKKLSLVEEYNGQLIETDSIHLSDGILRILAILAQLLTTESILIFDEIEDGINQEFVEKLVDTLLESSHQTIVATHSPMILNFIEDEIARKSILFVYKTKDGSTKVSNFFDVVNKYKIISEHEYELFGPGEIMQRVNLLDLTNSLVVD